MNHIDTMKQALEYLDSPSSKLWPAGTQYKIITALRAAIEHAENQQPVAWQWLDTGTFRKSLPASAEPGAWRALYTTPPQRQPEQDWETRAEIAEQQVVALAEERDHFKALYLSPPQRQPLTDEEILKISDLFGVEGFDPDLIEFTRAIEKAHGIRGVE